MVFIKVAFTSLVDSQTINKDYNSVTKADLRDYIDSKTRQNYVDLGKFDFSDDGKFMLFKEYIYFETSDESATPEEVMQAAQDLNLVNLMFNGDYCYARKIKQLPKFVNAVKVD